MLKFKESKSDVAFLPKVFNLNYDYEMLEVQQLIDEHKDIIIIDELNSQLRELIKIRNPKVILTEQDYEEQLQTLLGGKSMHYFGRWVYYPWNKKLVHLLGEAEFIELRTSRNLYKITPEERNILSKKIIAVIGLSVGQMIALTLVMERTCGEIRLADFDLIELSNMNRIRTSVTNIGISKAVVAAREIAEMDPYIKVKIYTDGITEQNIDAFLTKDGKIDVLVEECDGLDVKILSRIKARALGIPVVIDIERFDLEPSRPLLHGLIPENMGDLNALKNLSNQEKVPLLSAMVGIENISDRMRLSLTEMGNTISTWPQLASSVVLGGAMVTDVCRRILLKQTTLSGRYYVDFNELIK
jgi:hypothetical protein